MYNPEKLVAVSRYQNCFPTLPSDIQRDIHSRMAELIAEEKSNMRTVSRETIGFR